MPSRPARSVATIRINAAVRPPTEKGADRSAPLLPVQGQLSVRDYLLNSEYCSLPTKPNLVTFEALMMFSTRADRS